MPTVPCAAAIDKCGKRRASEGTLLAETVLEELNPFFTTLLDLLPDTETPAVRSVEPGRAPCSHARLRRFIAEEVDFWKYGVGRTDRVAILFPNGPELAVAFVAVLTYCTCAPLNPANTPQEIAGELKNVSAKAILVMRGEDNEGILAVAEELGLVVIEAVPSPDCCGVFEMSDGLAGEKAGEKTLHLAADKRRPQQRDDVAMVLHTSGSTGNKKVVPHTVEDLLSGAVCIASACQLTTDDICCNQMPLFHVGGIARNVLSPIISGGSVVAMPMFESNAFWNVVAAQKCTWYYAGPTMHMLILEAYKKFEPRPKISLRFIANAAGPLLPSVAEDMRDTYSAAAGGFCSIMPSYGMTECMPISSPPVGYNLDRPGTSGQIVGPMCQIQNGNGE